MKKSIHTMLLTAALLSSGCYCPMLSGRYSEIACPPLGAPAYCGCQQPDDSSQPKAINANGDCCPSDRHGGRLASRRAGTHGAVPSQQGPDYISPQAKFHPVPTRPVFEPFTLAEPLKPAAP